MQTSRQMPQRWLVEDASTLELCADDTLQVHGNQLIRTCCRVTAVSARWMLKHEQLTNCEHAYLQTYILSAMLSCIQQHRAAASDYSPCRLSKRTQQWQVHLNIYSTGLPHSLQSNSQLEWNSSGNTQDANLTCLQSHGLQAGIAIIFSRWIWHAWLVWMMLNHSQLTNQSDDREQLDQILELTAVCL